LFADAQYLLFFGVRLTRADNSKSAREYIGLDKRGYCLCFLFWGIPDDLIYPRGVTAIIFRHSPHGCCFAAKRVSQQAL
jgi:hypothetical protein